MSGNLKPFPSVKNIKESIKYFNDFDWETPLINLSSQEKYEYVGKRFLSKFQTSPVAFIQQYDKETFDLPLFRVRPFTESINSSLFCEYSYPPKILTETQRANYAQYPVFYSSTDVATALIEVVRNTNDIDGEKLYYLSCWGFRNPKGLKISFFVPPDLPNENPIRDIDLNGNLERALRSDGIGEKQIDSFKLLIEYQISLFTNPKENTYNLTAFLGHNFLYAEHIYKTDVLVYPSIKSNLLTANVALHPNIVDTSLYLKHVFLCRITKLDLETRECKMTIIQYGKVKQRIIYWRDPDPNDKEYEEITNYYLGFKNSVFTKV